MKKISTAAVALLLLYNSSKAQDYFTDLNSGNTPVIINNEQGKALFSAVINPTDASIKANFFRQYRLKDASFHVTDPKRHINFIGWGINTKTKTEDGLGTLISSGSFNPGFTGGAYLSYSRMHWRKLTDTSQQFGQWAVILSGTLSTSNFQLYHSQNPYATQLSDTSFKGRSISLSVVKLIFKGTNNLMIGLSATGSQMNNYGKLDKVNIKNDSIFNNDAGMTRIVQTVNDDGDVYANGDYRLYNNLNIRANVSFIPGALDYFMAFIFYPSLDFSKAFKPKYNLGFSFAHLKKGSPSVSDAALFLEFNDLNNASESTKPFFKRSFKFGVTTTLNIFTSNQ
jgi:hypothetical protein